MKRLGSNDDRRLSFLLGTKNRTATQDQDAGTHQSHRLLQDYFRRHARLEDIDAFGWVMITLMANIWLRRS